MEYKDLIERTINKMEKSQQKKKEVLQYIKANKPYLLGSDYKSGRIKSCCNVLKFKDYKDGTKRLYYSNFCKYDKFCLACSTRRSIKMIQRFEEGIQKYELYKKQRYHITLTVRHNKNQTLKTVLNKLCEAKEKLGKKYRNGKRVCQKKKSFMNYFDGIVSSIEVTYNEKNGRHPHIHILACSDYELPIQYLEKGQCYGNIQLQRERHSITGDSFQISMRKIDVDDNYFDRKGIGEVFKYAVKFSTLDIPHLVELIELQHNKKYHFFSTYGIFRGWKLDGESKEEDDNYVEKTFLYFNDEYSCIEENDRIEMNNNMVIDNISDGMEKIHIYHN